MKILQVNKFYYLRGGCERYVSELSSLLEKNGHQVIPFSMKDERNWMSEYENYFADNVNLEKFSVKNIIKFFYNRDAAEKLDQLVKKEKPDIAHLHNIAHHLTPAVIKVLQKNKIPVIQTLHDYKLICPNYRLFSQGEICHRCRGGKYYNCAKRKCIKDSRSKSVLAMLEAYLNNKIFKAYEGVDLFIAPSRFMKDVCVSFGVPEKKIKVLYNFVQPARIRSVPKPGTEDGYLLYYGRLSDEKGIETLLAAMESADYGFNLKIAGVGPDYKKLEIKISNSGLGSRAILTGPKFGEELEALINGAAAIIIPSIWPENMPMSMLESLARGKAVVASRIGGIPEIIKNGENGFLFSPGDAQDLGNKINEFLSSDKQKIYNRAVKTAERFYPENYYNNIIPIYKKIKHQVRRRGYIAQ